MTSPKDEKLIRELFEAFDNDNSGSISIRELKKGLRCIGSNPSRQEIREIMNEMGVKKGQSINYQQFSNCMAKYCTDHPQTDKKTVENDLRKSFDMFDKDKSGFVEKEELRKVLTGLGEKLTPQEVDEMFKVADKNGDGRINKEEFVRLFTQDIVQR
ncbi:neo-calmodulin-like isoform X2 [Dreissena polymorpha]|uniref:EF-hand domain-containing protein n=1 Tax=Dreissena polymorpha TaxID=45954 RepID=A0A9D4R3U1_DREPO|nr:neo-calmodulin-like isoform X2 [Dreissena polymorpha]KAH3854086.1 hypothetical protein DPMN_096625 [Dreissena polymorpha]